MLKKHAEVNILFMALLAGVLFSALAAASETNHISRPLRVRQLEGMKVEDSDGQKAGTIRNLALNMNTGDLQYVVIGYGGFFGVHATLKLAPAQVISTATVKSETLAINATTTQWRQAPPFKYSSLAAVGERDRANEISRYFQTSQTSMKSHAKGMEISLSKTGRNESSTTQPAQLKFASDVIGMRVVNEKREKMGEIVDLLVSFGEPRPAFAIVSGGRLLHHDRQFAVPLRALTSSDNRLIWKTDTAALQNAPEFDRAAWESAVGDSSNRVYRYTSPAN